MVRGGILMVCKEGEDRLIGKNRDRRRGREDVKEDDELTKPNTLIRRHFLETDIS
jgi:hypothetical protein